MLLTAFQREIHRHEAVVVFLFVLGLRPNVFVLAKIFFLFFAKYKTFNRISIFIYTPCTQNRHQQADGRGQDLTGLIFFLFFVTKSKSILYIRYNHKTTNLWQTYK